MDFTQNICDLPRKDMIMPIINQGRCDCIAIWVDYKLMSGTSTGTSQDEDDKTQDIFYHHMVDGCFPSYLKVNIRLFEHAQTVKVSTGTKEGIGTSTGDDGSKGNAIHCTTSFTTGDSDLVCEYNIV